MSAAAGPEEIPDLETLKDDGRNGTTIRCKNCPCIMLNPLQAKYQQKDIFLPHMKVKSADQKPEDGESLCDHWVVDNMYTFENIGFSKTVGTSKYLICADCEVGPVGYQDTTDPSSIYLAVARVRHSNAK